MKAINTVIFDIGNVLAEFIPNKFMEKLGYSGELKQKLLEAVIENDIWNEYDRGTMSKKEVIERFVERTPELEDDIRRVFCDLNGIVKRFNYTDRWIKDLKNIGIRVLFLSNISETLFNDCEKELDFIKNTDGGILSFQAKSIKPDREIYELLINRYELIPEECIFIDDRDINLDGGRQVGFNCIKFTEYDEVSRKILEKINLCE